MTLGIIILIGMIIIIIRLGRAIDKITLKADSGLYRLEQLVTAVEHSPFTKFAPFIPIFPIIFGMVKRIRKK